MEEKRGVARLAPFLARQELHLLGLRAELGSSPNLTVWRDAPLDPGAVVDPVIGSIREAAEMIGAPAQSRSRRGTLAGELSILWADVVELDPRRLERRWGLQGTPEWWAGAHAHLLAALDEALAANPHEEK